MRRVDYFSKETEIVGATTQALEEFARPFELPGQGPTRPYSAIGG